MAEQKQDNQLEHTYSSSVRIRDEALKTCQRRWTIGRSSERGPGISVLAARHDDDDDDDDEYQSFVCIQFKCQSSIWLTEKVNFTMIMFRWWCEKTLTSSVTLDYLSILIICKPNISCNIYFLCLKMSGCQCVFSWGGTGGCFSWQVSC